MNFKDLSSEIIIEIMANDMKAGFLYHPRYYQMQEELRRREAMPKSNDMPELKAGMIVETVSGTVKIVLPNKKGDRLVLVCRDGVYSNEGIDPETIKNIYILTGAYNYAPFFQGDKLNDEYFELIWSKPNSKIEEIEQTILKLQQEVEELKGENK